jgi:hypothetical protein
MSDVEVDDMATHPQRSISSHLASSVAGEIIDAGAFAGLVGGVAMALFATSYAQIVGLGFWTPMKAIAATVLGTSAFDISTASAVLIGLCIHVVVSVAIGIVFALATPKEVAPGPALAFGLSAGVTVLVIMNLIVLPIVSPEMRSHQMWGSMPGEIPVGIAFLMHLIYGAGLSLAPALRRGYRATSIS